MDEKTIYFYVLSASGYVPMKVTFRSTGYEFWLSSNITLRTKAITRVAAGVKLTIPTGYVGIIHSKSGLAMDGIHAITGVIDEDY